MQTGSRAQGLVCRVIRDTLHLGSFAGTFFVKCFFSAALSTAINITEGNRWIMLDPGCVCVCMFVLHIFQASDLGLVKDTPVWPSPISSCVGPPLDKSQLIRCPYEIRNYVTMFDFFKCDMDHS